MTEPRIDIVHVGSACRDLTDEDPRGWRLGGGASYAALTTARLGLRTAAIMGVDAIAASASELDLLRAAGVELLLVALEEGPVFLNRETPEGRVQSWPARGLPLPVPTFPDGWRDARAWSLVPVASELGDAWASVPGAGFTSLAWQGLLREQGPDQLTRRTPPRGSALLDAADLVGVSRHDLPPGTPLAARDQPPPAGRPAGCDGRSRWRLADPNPARRADPDGRLVRGPTCAPCRPDRRRGRLPRSAGGGDRAA